MRTFGLLPLPVLYVLGRIISFVAFDIMRWHRRLAADNIARSFPEKSDAQRAAILRNNYSNLGRTFAEAV
ncbi:MAG: lipid A biosynthesis acyltransferase, partial [Casimicrobiaceae bacterium]